MKYSTLNKFGSSYTWSNLDDEYLINILYMQICMGAEQTYMEFQQHKADGYSKMYQGRH